MHFLVATALTLALASPAGGDAIGARVSAPIGDQVRLRVGARHQAVATIRLPDNVAVLTADRHRCTRSDDFSASTYRCTGRGPVTFDVRVRKASGTPGEVKVEHADAEITVTGTGGPGLQFGRLGQLLPLTRQNQYAAAGVLMLLVSGLGLLLVLRRRRG